MSAAVDRAPLSQGPTKQIKSPHVKRKSRIVSAPEQFKGLKPPPPYFPLYFWKPVKFVLGVPKWTKFYVTEGSQPLAADRPLFLTASGYRSSHGYYQC